MSPQIQSVSPRGSTVWLRPRAALCLAPETRQHCAINDGPIKGYELAIISIVRYQMKQAKDAIRKQVIAETNAAITKALNGGAGR